MRPVELNRVEVIEDMKRVNCEYGGLTKKLYTEHGNFAYSTVVKKVGKFNELKAEALGNVKLHVTDIPKDALVQDVLSIYEQEGKITQELYLEKGKYSRKPILKHFGSWNNMLKELDIDFNCLINIPDEELLDDLKRLFVENDDVSATIVKHHGKFSVEVYQRRFGSFNNALDKAGLKTRVRGRTSPIADSMIRMIEEILHEKAQPEVTAWWFYNPETGRRLYVDAWFPAHNIVFEYNGPQHYQEVEYYRGKHSLEHRIKLDKLKADLLHDKGYRLLVFKYDEPHTREHMIVKLAEIFKQ
jgi:hypothetical protein